MEWISVDDDLPSGFIETEPGMTDLEEYIVHVEGAELATVGLFINGEFAPLEGRHFNGRIDYWMRFPLPPRK